jgi:hypothetical protein
MSNATLTAAQHALITAILRSDYNDEQGPDASTWAWDALEGSGLDVASFGGVVAKAKEAGVIWHQSGTDRVNGRIVDASVIGLTEAGWEAFQAYKA